jgi:eukaryotic-like serine/threonine-protein kinase
MVSFDAGSLADQVVLLGLATREQVREARDDAEDGSLDALTRSLTRKGLLTSWQLDKISKGETSGFLFGGYKVLFHLAEGTFARVYRGRRLQGDAPVAIKVLRQRFVADPAAVKSFSQEAEAGMKLIHPNIVRTIDFGEQDRKYYMILEYVEGSNLRDFLKRRRALSPAEALPMMIGLSRGLKYSLDNGVTHRDLKATNILVASNGEAKLVDFGLATLDEAQKKTATASGQRTVDYSALERTCGSPKGDPRSDIFFLGCVFYQMLTGQAPMPETETKDQLAKMLKRSFSAIKPLADQRNPPPPALARIIEKMMKVDLKARYQTMDEVLADLEAYQAHPDGSAAAPTASPSTGPALDSDEELFRNLFVTPTATQDAPEPPPPPTPKEKHVLCVEVQAEVQEAFRKALAKMGYRTTLVGDAQQAVQQYEATRPDVVVFDADGLGPAAFDTFLAMHQKAHAEGHGLTALVILGPRQQDLAKKMPVDDRLVVLTKPMKLRDVQEALAQLVPVG